MSGLLYPDNKNRADRTNDLTNSISHIHATLSDENDRLLKEDEHVHELLTQLSSNAGLSGPEEYVNMARNVLDDEDKAVLDDLLGDLDESTRKFEIVFMVTGALGAMGGAAWLAPNIVKGFSNVALGLRAVPQLSRNLLTGNIAAFNSAQRMAQRWNVAARTRPGGGVAAPASASRFATAMKNLSKFGKFLTVASILAFIGGLIAEAVQGAKLRDELRNAIDELCAMRHVVKKISMMLFSSQGIKSQLYGYLSTKVTLDQMVADGFITPQQRDESLQKGLENLLPLLIEDVADVTDQAVADATALMDKDVDSWTNEDPSLTEILKWIDEQEAVDEISDSGPKLPDVDDDDDDDDDDDVEDVKNVKGSDEQAAKKQRKKLRRRIRKMLKAAQEAQAAPDS